MAFTVAGKLPTATMKNYAEQTSLFVRLVPGSETVILEERGLSYCCYGSSMEDGGDTGAEREEEVG